ncbi:hypothetical protein E0Z06_09500 [Rheinheimera sp. D18]|uniref:hypothetical protein n=1 Tax=Rheinheimera sp. D18 TaxID=2545632 RepID=UPI00104890C3|nr:hypothetical protein [Rheinheimera sp. D18]QBL09734.1 hypothetical protein E0Z06_09500 [Rheinheimera sp. D18]
MRVLIYGAMLGLVLGCSDPVEQTKEPVASQDNYTVMLNGNTVGHLNVTTNLIPSGSQIKVDFDYKSNGRGPGSQESLTLDQQGVPTNWQISGNTTFGNSITEYMHSLGEKVSWQDATGSGEKTLQQSALYVPQNSSPYTQYILAKALMQTENKTMPALPAGQLSLEKLESLNIDTDGSKLNLMTYALAGANVNPDYLVVDSKQQFFAFITPQYIVIRQGFEAEEAQLRQLSAKYSTDRLGRGLYVAS